MLALRTVVELASEDIITPLCLFFEILTNFIEKLNFIYYYNSKILYLYYKEMVFFKARKLLK